MVETRDLPGVTRSSIVTVVGGGAQVCPGYLTAGRPGIFSVGAEQGWQHNTGRLVQVLLSLSPARVASSQSLMISILSGTDT